jgi:hypothetical protein
VRLHGLDVSPQEVEQRRKVQRCPHAKRVRHDVGVGQGPLPHRQRLVRRATQPAGQGPIGQADGRRVLTIMGHVGVWLPASGCRPLCSRWTKQQVSPMIVRRGGVGAGLVFINFGIDEIANSCLRSESRCLMEKLSKKKQAAVRDREQTAVVHDVAQ